MTVNPLSVVLERLQELAKSKGNDSIFTGSEFKDQYTTAGMPREIRNTVAFAGGDIQTAYSNINGAYEILKDRNGNREMEYRIDKERENIDLSMIKSDLNIAQEKLLKAQNRVKPIEDELVDGEFLLNEIQTLRADINQHIESIENTDTIVLQ